jgi:hypothetical protein
MRVSLTSSQALEFLRPLSGNALTPGRSPPPLQRERARSTAETHAPLLVSPVADDVPDDVEAEERGRRRGHVGTLDSAALNSRLGASPAGRNRRTHCVTLPGGPGSRHPVWRPGGPSWSGATVTCPAIRGQHTRDSKIRSTSPEIRSKRQSRGQKQSKRGPRIQTLGSGFGR